MGVALLETASAFCGRAALLLIEEKTIVGWRASGFRAGLDEALAAFRLPVRDAPAFLQAVESRDPVVARAVPEELSPGLFELLAPQPGQTVWLFPLAAGTSAMAVLYADAAGAEEGVQAAAVELLCAVAEASIAALSARAAPRRAAEPEVVGVRRATAPAPVDWNQLSAAERDLHQRAQRYARILVADLLLHRAQQIREGRKSGNLYGLLKAEIDQSREAYHRKFPNSTASGADYFHQELVRTLAGNQESLMGPEYPGAQV